MSEQLLADQRPRRPLRRKPRRQDRHRDVSLDIRARRDGEPRGRVRIGKDDDRPGDPRPRARHRRHDQLPRSGDQQHLPRTAPSGRTRHPGHLPGPVLVAQPVDDGREHPRRTAPRRRSDRGPHARAGTAGCRRHCPPTPGRATRASSPAVSGSASPSRGLSRWTRGHRLRRAHQRPRRHDAGARSRAARRTCRRTPASPTSSSAMTSAWCTPSATASPS